MKARAACAVALLLAAAVGCASTPAPIATPSTATGTPSSLGSTPPAPMRDVPRCRHASYIVKMVQPISPMTGEHALMIQIMRSGKGRCSVIGYPRVRFYAADGTRLPFRYRESGGQYLTDQPPYAINLHPVDSFFVGIAKYRCDVRTIKTAKYALLRLPGGTVPVKVRLHDVASIDYCAQRSSRVVYLSPIVGPEKDLFAD